MSTETPQAPANSTAATPQTSQAPQPPQGAQKLAYALLLCAIGIALNFAGSQIAAAFGLPLYLDCIGTIVAGALGGYIPGIAVGYITNFITSATGDPSSFYYCLTSVLIGLAAAQLGKRGWFEKLPTVLLSILVFVLIGGVLGSIITFLLYGAYGGTSGILAEIIHGATGWSDFPSQLSADVLVDIVDKALSVLVAVLIVNLLPARAKGKINFQIWRQAPLTAGQLAAVRENKTRSVRLRGKIVFVVGAVMIIVALVCVGISYVMYHRSNIEAQGKTALGITNLAVQQIDPDRLNDYLANGDTAPGYTETSRALAQIRDAFPDVEYVYVYQIKEDGCHVIFDPDTATEQGSALGEVIPFDEDFLPYIDDLLAGEPIDPIVSNGSYGWLLTAYQPLYDSNGDTVCYVCVDVAMTHLIEDELAFIIRVIILFAAFFVVICAFVIWLAEYNIVLPVNSISWAANSFAFDSEAAREANVRNLESLGIRTGDEVENLYRAVTKASEDTLDYIAEAQEKAATIERMQDNLIMVMADLVESRDKHTGDHVRKTAAYCDIVMKQMRKEGMYPDELTDEFMENVVKSAPLHDIGKIHVSDAILNKPGRLTDEEFSVMQGHTLAGKVILEDAVGAMSDPGYLDEAQRLAAYHHEKWNGKGYPHGLAGEDIPLSARIMAVADVFDALVSKRSYKEGMPIEKALQIIHDDAGTHFDPQVAMAFLHAEAEVRRVAAAHGDDQGTASDIRDSE